MSNEQPTAMWESRGQPLTILRKARARWLSRHGISSDAYRVEFYLKDKPSIRVFTFHRNECGDFHWTPNHSGGTLHDHSQCGVAANPPYDRPLWEMPPEDLL